MQSNTETSTITRRQVRKIVFQTILMVGAAIAVAWLLYALRAVLLLLALTAIFCYLIAPLVDFFKRPRPVGQFMIRIPHSMAIIIVYLLLGGGIIFSVDKLAPVLSDQFGAFIDNTPVYARRLDEYSKYILSLPARYRLPSGLRRSLTEWLSLRIDGLIEWVQEIAYRTVRLAPYLLWLVLIPVLGFFFLKDARAISDRFLSSLSEEDLRYRVTIFLKDVSETLASYIRAQLVACLIVGAIVGTGLWLLGLPYPLVFTVAAGTFEFIPVIGPLTLGVVAVLVASFHSLKSAIVVFAFLSVFRLIHDYAIYPRLISKGVKVHPVVVILAVLSGAEIGGVVGVFLSIPIAALLIVCWRHWRDLKLNRPRVRSASSVHPGYASLPACGHISHGQ
jgi:predicted PurR-regulated permease PerM